MRLLLLGLLIGAVLADKYDDILKKIHEDNPWNGFSPETFQKPSFALNLETDDRLPREVVVHYYDIVLEPFFDYAGFKYDKKLRNTFDGQVTIHFSVLNSTNKVELASAVKLASSGLTENRRVIKIQKTETDENDHLIVHSAEKLYPAKNYTLIFKYKNNMSIAGNGGVYFFEYETPEKTNTSLVATIFETTHAREAFPCFDDPFFKSSFKISLVHPKGAKVYSNEEIAEQRYFDEQRVITRFRPTVKMSTYLVAFAIGDFIESSSTSKSGVVNRAVAIRNYEGLTQDSADFGAKCVDVIESLVGYKYPLKKLDHLDTVKMAMAGMENFGLNIYAGVVPNQIGQLFWYEAGRKKMICHETAHQWFGDIVTADRWGFEFLHEAFANYFEAHALGEMEEFSYLADFEKISRIMFAVDLYSLADHPIVDTISHFDGVTYYVGGGLLISIRHVLSDKVFYEGLKIYQQENAFANADLDALLGSWVKAAKTDIVCGKLTFTEFAKDYFLRAGVPTVTIKKDDSKFIIRQLSSTGYYWNVPIHVLDLKTDKEHILWLLKDNTICSPHGFQLQADGEYVFNNEGKGFAKYTVSKPLQEAAANHEKFPYFSYFNQFYILYHLRFVVSTEEMQSIVLNAAKKKNGDIHSALLGAISMQTAVYREVVELFCNQLDYQPTSKNRLIGGHVLENAVVYNIPSVVKKTTQLFEQFKKDCAPEKELVDCPQIPPEFRKAVYVQGAKTPEGAEFLQAYGARIRQHKWFKHMKSEYDRTQDEED